MPPARINRFPGWEQFLASYLQVAARTAAAARAAERAAKLAAGDLSALLEEYEEAPSGPVTVDIPASSAAGSTGSYYDDVIMDPCGAAACTSAGSGPAAGRDVGLPPCKVLGIACFGWRVTEL